MIYMYDIKGKSRSEAKTQSEAWGRKEKGSFPGGGKMITG
jgi:hypothetical protein